MSFNLNFQNIEEKKVHLDSLVDIPSINPKDYDSGIKYNRLDFLVHDEFGPGFVDNILPSDEISVFFAHGVEILVHNRLDRLVS